MGKGKRVPEHALTAEEREFLSTCLQEARRSIHEDYEKAPSQFKALFLYMEREIFNFNFTIGAARDAANFKSNSYTTRFYKITGKRPREYVEHHRIMAAQKIIKQTDIYHWQVGSMVGFSDPSVFSRNYRKVVGYPPRKESKPDALTNNTKPERQLGARPETVGSRNLDPRVSATTPEIITGTSRLNLGKFWEDIRHMTRLKIKEHILKHIKVISVDHYYYLLEKAKYESRFDRGRGKELCLSGS